MGSKFVNNGEPKILRPSDEGLFYLIFSLYSMNCILSHSRHTIRVKSSTIHFLIIIYKKYVSALNFDELFPLFQAMEFSYNIQNILYTTVISTHIPPINTTKS